MPCISLIHVHLFTFSMPSSKVLLLPVSILDESHAELVDTHLGRQPGEPRPSENLYHCVTDEKGRPVSWVLSDELCELKMAYTLLEYRRAGRCLWLWSTGWALSVCPSTVTSTSRTKLLVTLWRGFDACPSMENISAMQICKDRVWASQTNDN